VRSHPSMHVRGILTAVAVLVGVSLAGCLSGKHAKPTPQTDLAAANDAKLVERMERMRTRALNAPGGALEASDFATQLTLLHNQGVAKRKSLDPSLVDEAVRCLDQARDAKPDDAADLLVRKGELLLAADRQAAGVAALKESVAARPNLRAFTFLVKAYTAQKQNAEIEALCKKTLPAMKSESSRYAVLDECLKCSGAATPEAGLRWAGKGEISFYKARRKELEAHAPPAAKPKK